MFLRDFFLALVRRWYLMLVGAVLAIVAAYFVWGSTGANYSARSIVMLLPPAMTTQSRTPGVPDGNPLLYLGSLSPARDALLVAMTGDEAQMAFQQKFPGSGFRVGPDTASSGPSIVVETQSFAASVALDSVHFAVEEVSTTLDLMQDRLDVDEDARVRSMTLTSATVARRDAQPQLRAAVVTGGGIAAATVLLIGLIDGLARLRNRRRAGVEGKSGSMSPSVEDDTSAPAAKPANSSAASGDADNAHRSTPEASQPTESGDDLDADEAILEPSEV